MNFIKMTNDQLKAFLDEHDVDHSEAKVKADLVQLAENVKLEADEPKGLAAKVQSAIKIERTETKKVDETSYLANRDYSQLSVGERALIRERSPEYEDVEGGVKVHVTDRLATKWRVVKRADKSYARMFKGVGYTLANNDYEAMKDESVKVKTEATKNKCCGQARYETVPLFEVI